MASKTGKKGKKPIQTTLGKASCQNEKEVDLSHVQKPIHTSIFGLRQVLSLFQTATEEVQNYITYECDIMYECRICRTIFRSLANFILHKRNYCRERFALVDPLSNNENNQEVQCSENTQEKKNSESRPVTPEHKEPSYKEVRKGLSPIIEKLKENQEIRKLAQEALNEDLSSKETVVEFSKLEDEKSKSSDLLLEKIATNNAAVFQTMLQKLPTQQQKNSEHMKSEVMEIHGMLESDEAVLGPDGKICSFETNKINKNPVIPKGELFCTECNLKFSTKKTLTYHIKYKHNNTRLVYVCPDCKDTFANAWCVYRHLYKIHRRTSAQIKRMRDQVHNNYIRKDQEPAKKKDKKTAERVDKTDEENQWLNNIEGDNDFQMCGGCGKRFERKAALHSHAQMCVKRIAVCNTIKENNAKRKEEEFKENKNKISKPEKAGPSEILKGSSKRKPYLLRTYKPNDKIATDKEDVTHTEGDCDVNANCEIVENNCDSGRSNRGGIQVIEKVRNSSSSTEEQLSPSKIKDICGSPSIDKMDTEKMLNIIGITPISENLTVNKDGEEKHYLPKNIIDNRSHTASDFDTFCQSITNELVTDVLEETESNLHKASRRIPLILRRKNSAKSEKKNSILDQSSKELIVANKQLDPNNAEPNTDKTHTVNIKSDAQLNEIVSAEPESLPSTSAIRISVKKLADLIGVSTEDHIKNSEIKECLSSNECHTESVGIEPVNITQLPVSTFTEVSDTIRANISPEKFPKKFSKSLKRKRTSSFDSIEINKPLKGAAADLEPNKQGVSFMTKASPYMDQNKLLCIPCQLSYTKLSKLLWHMSAHFSWFRFQCSRCSFISFNKFDCANHARKNHNVKKKSMKSVVLPIPNWKTALMAHDFCMLKNENDLSGKHTDEVIFGNQEECAMTENTDEKIKIGDGVTDWFDNLFADSNDLDSESEHFSDFSGYPGKIKQENTDLGIDVINEDKDLFQIEVPQEIYTLDVSELINVVDHEERVSLSGHSNTEKVISDETEEYYCKPARNETDIKDDLEDSGKAETAASDNEITECICNNKNEEDTFETELNLEKIPERIVNIRPTRNRTKSIKTLQDDFFYDLSKVIKLNDSSVSKPTSKPTLQKQKKSTSCSSQKNGRESASSSSKNETKALRVYSKKK